MPNKPYMYMIQNDLSSPLNQPRFTYTYLYTYFWEISFTTNNYNDEEEISIKG